jgi:hypothetical protein
MVVPEKIIIEIEMRLKKAQKDLDAYTKKTNQMTKVNAKQFDAYGKKLDKVTELQNNLTKVTGRTQRAFAGWAMSLMFFGMALQRVFQQVWKFGTSTFNDVMHSVEGTATQFDMLQGSLKYLGFTVGQALEPLAASLIPIVDLITDLVQRNPEMVAGIVKWTGILGTIFMVGGTGTLALNGFWELQNKIMGANTSANTLIDNIGRILGTVILIDAVLKIATKKEDLYSQIDNLFLGAGLLAGATNPWGAAMITVGVAFKLFPNFMDKVVYLFAEMWMRIAANATAAFEGIIQKIANAINSIIAVYNAVTGKSVAGVQIGDWSGGYRMRAEDFKAARKGDEAAESRLAEGLTPYFEQSGAPVFKIELDGEELMNILTTKITDRIQR